MPIKSKFAPAPDAATFVRRYMKPRRVTATTVEWVEQQVADFGYANLATHDNITGCFLYWCPEGIEALQAIQRARRGCRLVTETV